MSLSFFLLLELKAPQTISNQENDAVGEGLFLFKAFLVALDLALIGLPQECFLQLHYIWMPSIISTIPSSSQDTQLHCIIFSFPQAWKCCWVCGGSTKLFPELCVRNFILVFFSVPLYYYTENKISVWRLKVSLCSREEGIFTGLAAGSAYEELSF